MCLSKSMKKKKKKLILNVVLFIDFKKLIKKYNIF